MAYSSSNAQARAISHRTWSRKKAPISRVGSYDFNGGVDRATMKMHMAAADRPQGHTQVVTLWPLASTAIDKNECFAVREREVLWTMRPGKGMGRTSDGRMRALSSLNYFRLVLSDDQRDALAAAMGMQGKSSAEVMAALKSLVGPKRMEHTATRVMTLDMLNKVDHLLRSYVLAVIQYAGVAITGEEAGSRQHLQGIAVTVGGLNTLANNSEKTLCPGMKLCMTVPRCVPESTAWPAPCDHIGLPHGKVVPILRQADGTELMDVLMGPEKSSIYRHVAQLMTGCCSASSMRTDVKDEDVPVDVYFAFQSGTNNAYLKTVKKDLTSVDVQIAEIQNDQLDVMRRMNDAIVFTMSKKATQLEDFGNRFKSMIDYDGTVFKETDLVFGAPEKYPANAGSTNVGGVAKPKRNTIPPIWRLLIIAFGNVRNIVLAHKYAATDSGARMFRKSKTPIGNSLYNNNGDITNVTNKSTGLGKMFEEKYGGKVPACLQNGAIDNTNDLDASKYAAMIVHVMDNVAKWLDKEEITISDGTSDMFPTSVKYHKMNAVSNGNAAFSLGNRDNPMQQDSNTYDALNLNNGQFQPNIVVLDEKVQYPWDTTGVSNIVKAKNADSDVKHAAYTIVFRNSFQAPVRVKPSNQSALPGIQLSDNELPFVGAWLAVPAGNELKTSTPYRSDFQPIRFKVLEKDGVDYYYLTWSAIVHLVCHNVLQQHYMGRVVLEMNEATLVSQPHYSNATTNLEPTLQTKRNFGAPGLSAFLHAILRPDTDATTQYQDYLRKHSPIASLVKNVVQATVQAVTQHQLTTEKKTVGMALSSAARGEAVDVVLTGAV